MTETPVPAHARLAASATERWMACPGSIAASLGAPDNTSFYAAEGTVAHKVLSQLLDQRFGVPGNEPPLEVGDTVFQDGHDIVVDEDMFAHGETVAEHVGRELERLGSAELHTEQKLPLNGLGRLDMGGTGDVVIVSPFNELVVEDYKYGAGVVVEVQDNPQLKTYAVGALLRWGEDFERVVLRIHQPRARHADGPTREWVTTPDDLMAWANEELLPAADRTDHADAPRRAGSHCFFCPAKGRCDVAQAAVQELAALDFSVDPPDALAVALGEAQHPASTVVPDGPTLARLLKWVPLVDAWCKAIEAEALNELKAGREVPGYKLVRKKANRKWIDEEAFKALLKKKRVKDEDIFAPRKLKSPAQMEKTIAVGKGLVKEHCYKPEGGITMVPVTDPREEVPPSAVTDFLEADKEEDSQT